MYQTLLEEKNALAAKNREVLAETKRAKETARRFEGIDPEEYKTLKQQAEETAQRKALEEGNLEAWKKQFVDQFSKEKEPILNENKTLKSAVEALTVDAQATSALADAKGSPKVLLPHIKANVRVMLEEGNYVARVVDERGNVRIGDAQGNPMTIAQFVAEMKQDPDFARNFEGTGSSGGGATKSTAGGGGNRQTIAVGNSGTLSMKDIDAINSGANVVAQ